MNCYTYNEISVGDIEAFTVTITDEMMSGFGAITGDMNPLHTDELFASAAGFKSKVVYGMLMASFMSTIAGMYLPGKHSLIHKIETEFPQPCFVGDTLSITGEVVNKNDTFKTIELKITARNEAEKKVLRGKMRIGVLQ